MIDISLTDSNDNTISGLVYQPGDDRDIFDGYQFDDIPLLGGSGSGARVSITFSKDGEDEIVSNIRISDGGSGYLENDILSIDGEEYLSRIVSASPLKVGTELVQMITQGKKDDYENGAEYTNVPLLLSGGFPSGAEATVVTTTANGVISIIVTNAGDSVFTTDLDLEIQAEKTVPSPKESLFLNLI